MIRIFNPSLEGNYIYGTKYSQHNLTNSIRVTIHESEEDDFKSEFHRNCNRKGFNNTKLKRRYSGVV